MRKVSVGVLCVAAVGGVAAWIILGRTSGDLKTDYLLPAHAREQTPVAKVPASPLRVRFEVENTPAQEETSQVALIVERDPKLWPGPISSEAPLEILLRLPVGVKLKSLGWQVVPSSETESRDSGGPWFLFQRQEAITPSGKDSTVLARIPLDLKVAEDGVNWIVTARAKLQQVDKTLSAFAVVFATRKAGKTEFHLTPNVQTD